MEDMTQENDKPVILVVDDSRVVRKTIIKILGPDFNIIEAGDGIAAWRMLKQNSLIDTVITDIQMPEMDGYSFICKVRAADEPDFCNIPMIVITSADDEITRERAYACGASDFVLKPFNAQQMLECVRAQLANNQKAAEEITTAEVHEPVTEQAQAPAANETVASAETPEPSVTPITNVVPVTTQNTGDSTMKDAVKHFDVGLGILRSQKTSNIAPFALELVLRFFPLLKYCNAKFNFGMEKELTLFQKKIIEAKARRDLARTETAA